MTELEDKTKDILLDWVSRKGHDRCWWHPDLLERLGKLYGLDMAPATTRVSIDEFRRGCRLYQATEYGLPIPEDCRDIIL